VISIELFPCSGGLAEGFRRAGVTFDLAFDADADACDSYGIR
jgi:site-specific DNA-cytosine methylase